MKKIYFLDAYALIFRGYYALFRSPIIDSKGNNNSAVFGFMNTLLDIVKNHEPDFLAVAFDPAGPTFRHEMYPEYKAQRDATPEEIHRAVPIIKEVLAAWGIPSYEVAGYEADDVIGTLALQAEKEGLDVHMVTPDKDYGQLVGPRIAMERPSTGGIEHWGVEEICEKFSIDAPAQVVDYLALLGDTADNVPGCPGVGKVTAAKYLKQFGSVERLIENAATDLKGKAREKIIENAENIRFSKKLVTICTTVPIALDLEATRLAAPNLELLRPLLERLEFRNMLERITGEAPKKKKTVISQPSLFDEMPANGEEAPAMRRFETLADVPHHYELVDTDAAAKELCDILLTQKIVSFDTETTSLTALDAEIVGLSFATEKGRAWYVSVPRETSAARQRVEIFRRLFENTEIVKVAQNAKYDFQVLGNYGIVPAAPMFDTMLAHYLIQPELYHNMDYLAETYLHYSPIPISSLIGAKGSHAQANMADLSPAAITDYAAEDADVTLQLHAPLTKEMEEAALTRCFEEIEMPLMPVLARMERNGVCLNLEALAETGRQFTERMNSLEAEVYELAGHTFTITSPKQVGEVLFDELKLNDKAKKTKKGQYSTSEEVLEALREKHPIVGKILAHRALKKLISTYIDALPRLVNPRTGHIHTSFNQAVTATGRLSSSNPNLQNIPVRGDDGKEIRKAFVAEPGCTFFSADYSQIELRIMAHLSGDEHMIADFRDGRDIHAATAARIFNKPVDEVTPDERRKAKTANFGIIYGISAFGLAERMGVSRTEAKELIDNYFATYPGVRKFINESIETARAKGYIETQFGRRRYLPDITSRNAVVRSYAERNAVNAPIQGTAADIIKLAMIRIDRRLQAEGLEAKMMLQVHDELNFSVRPEELPRLRKLVIEEMENAYPMQVPLIADCGEGENWLEAH